MNDVATNDDSTVVAPTPQANLLSPEQLVTALISGASGLDVEKITALEGVYRRAKENEQKDAFHAAMSLAQAELVTVVKDTDNTHTNSKYASIAAIHRAVMPVVTRHGFSVSFYPLGGKDDTHIGVGVTLAHKGGHSIEYSEQVPLDKVGAKGTVNKTSIQAMGSSKTYAQRYMILGLFNVAVANDDIDGNEESNKANLVTQEQANLLRTEFSGLVDEGNDQAKSEKAFLEMFTKAGGLILVTRFEGLPKDTFDKARNNISIRLAKKEPAT